MPNDVDRYVGLAIQRARRAKGLTQSDLADKVGVSFQQIHKYESASNRISASMLAAVAEGLGVSVCDLFPPRLRSFNPRDGELELLIHFRALSKEQRICLLNDIRRSG